VQEIAGQADLGIKNLGLHRTEVGTTFVKASFGFYGENKRCFSGMIGNIPDTF
jgi:hypothetical protein